MTGVSDFTARQPIVAAVIVAAGRGLRAGGVANQAKQFRVIAGKTVLERAVACFDIPIVTGPIAVVAHPDEIERTKICLRRCGADIVVTTGGATRQQSVNAGLKALVPYCPDIVLIHDAARPFADTALIGRVLAGIDAKSAALPAVAIADTIKRAGVDATVDETIDRRGLFGAQTPQGFAYEAIREAHARAIDAGRDDFTDDSALAEWGGLTVRLVEGSPNNFKLTYADDFTRAETIVRGEQMIDVRTGNGYDVHQLVPGDHVTLCGVRMPHDQSLSGHSDADVGLHALTDALLATCGAGDIGTHFPPTEERWRGAASSLFVRHAAEIVRNSGGRICNVDVTLIAEAPKIAPYRETMQAAMAGMLDLDENRVSVKATTNETIGFIGRREGIAAIATASVSYGDPSR